MAESNSSRNLVGLFQKKSEKRKEDNPNIDKKKKHKRRYSVRLIKAWKFDKVESEIDPSRTGAEGNGARNTVDTKASYEKEKPKNTRRRLPFGKPRALGQKELSSSEDTTEAVEDEEAPLQSTPTNELWKSNEHQSDSEQIEIRELEDDGEEELSCQGDTVPEVPPEDEVKEVLLEMVAEIGVSPQDLIPDVASETQKNAGISTPNTCPDENPAIVPNPEEEPSGFEDKISPLKELMFNEERASQVDAICSKFHCEVCLYVYDFSIGSLIGVWSFVVGLAKDATKQVFLYFISSLIKRYPHCFKVQLKKGKHRSQMAKPKKVTFSEII